ncbi:MAG: glycosyltransferase family A protein [Tissierellia bacterium]|nr:glycosyltransferase family A protein [Tissierellia bacterium]
MSISLVSIIVPCYNQAKYLPKTIESVISQSCKSWECIIINDGSTDNTEEVANNLCKIDERLRYIYQSNKGVCATRNNAISQSKGEYILCLDGDDYISKNFIEEMVKVLDNNLNVKVVTSKVQLFGEKNKELKLPAYSIEKLIEQNLFIMTSMFRRIDFDLSPGFNENMKNGLEDWDFWISLLKKGGDVVHLNNIIFYYRIKKNSRNKNITKKEFEELYKSLYYNHEELFSSYYSNFQNYIKNVRLRNTSVYKLYNKIRSLMTN